MDTVEKNLRKAKKIFRDPDQVSEVLSRVAAKLKNFDSNSTQWKNFKSKVNILVKMIQSHISGKYPAFSSSSILLIIFALIYFITPLDAIPDFVPALGFTDDASVLFFIYQKLDKDIDKFLKWSNQSNDPVDNAN